MSKPIYLGDEPTLFLDISSTCTGWCVGSMDRRTKKATISKAGVIWFDKKWEHGFKYNYLDKFITDFAYILYGVCHIVAEGYMFNKNRVMGTAVIPEATGSVKAICYEMDPPLDFYSVYPQTWRSILGIKKDTKATGTKMWKEPTKKLVNKRFPKQIPEKLVSNVTGKERPTPYDLFDSICIALAWFEHENNGCTKITIDGEAFKNTTVNV